MFCIQCAAENQTDAKFCYKCGAAMSIPQQTPGLLTVEEREPQLAQMATEPPVEAVMQPRPWVRFWARLIDTSLLGCVISILLIAAMSFLRGLITTLSQFYWATGLIFSIALFLFIFGEAFLLSKFGTTPGKWLLRIQLAHASGEPITVLQAAKRFASVWCYGLGLGIPIYSFFAKIIAYVKLKRNGITSWDKEGGFTVSHSDIGIQRMLVVIICILGSLFLAFATGFTNYLVRTDVDRFVDSITEDTYSPKSSTTTNVEKKVNDNSNETQSTIQPETSTDTAGGIEPNPKASTTTLADEGRINIKQGNIYYDNVRLTTSGKASQAALSPDGKQIVFVLTPDETTTELWLMDVTGQNAHSIIQSREHEDVKQNLTEIRKPVFSLDGKAVYFLTHAWATSNAVHVIDLETNKQWFITDGNSLALVPSGNYRGYLITQKHRYHEGGGSYDDYWLVSPKGETIKSLGEDQEHVEEKLEAQGKEQVLTSIDWQSQANDLYDKKDWPGVLKHALRWSQAQPENISAWQNLGIGHLFSKQYDKAIEAFQQAVSINPEHKHTWALLGAAYNETNQYDKAIEALQKAIRINPENGNAWHSLGISYENSKQYDKAIEADLQANRINPGNAPTWNNLGNVYTATEQPAKAIEAYQQAVRIDPKYAKAWNRLGVLYAEANQYDKAIEAYQPAVLINPEFAVAWNNLGIAYNKTKQYAKANDAYRQAVRIEPKDDNAWVALAVSYGRTNQTDKAIESFQQAARINPENAHAWFLFGLAYGKSYQPDKTFENYNQEISIAVETALTTQEREGMVGLQIEVADCYKKQKNESYCFYLDIASRQLDQIFSEGMQMHFPSNDFPHNDFFTEEEVRARIEPGFTKLKMDKNTANKYIADASLEIKGLLIKGITDNK